MNKQKKKLWKIIAIYDHSNEITLGTETERVNTTCYGGMIRDVDRFC